MSIEQAIEKNTAALEALTAAVLATAKLAPGAAASTGTGSTKAADKKADAAPKATREEMTAVLKELGETKGAEVAVAIIKEIGKSPKMAQIKDAQVDAVYKAAKVKLEEEVAADDDSGGL